MNPKVMAAAEALAEALAESEEVKAYRDAREQVEQHAAANIMLRDFQQKQMALERKAAAGQAPTEAEIAALQDAYRILALNPYVRKVIEAEAAFAQMFAAVQETIARAVGIEPVQDEDEDDASSPSEPKREDSGGTSRLWVPGR